MEILSEFESHYVPNVFRKDDLIKVFIHLRIMAKVGDGEYLMPCLLKNFKVKGLPTNCGSIIKVTRCINVCFCF